MKRIILWSSVALIVVAAGILVVRADGRGRHGWGCRGWGHPGPLGFIAYELKLSDTQRAQIKSMWQAERPAAASLVQELAAESEEMIAATAKGDLDEAKVQEIASRQGGTIAKLLVEKEHFRAKVYTTVLNQEQRDKADELQKTLHSRMERVARKLANGPNSESQHR